MSTRADPLRSIRRAASHLVDRLLEADLGLVRLHAGLRALLCVPAGMAAGWYLSSLFGLPATIGLMVGALPPFLSCFIIAGDRTGRTAARSAAMLVPFVIGLIGSLALQADHVAELVLLVLLLFAQFYGARFGTWSGDFTATLFAAFLCGLLLPLPFDAIDALIVIAAGALAAAIAVRAAVLRPSADQMLSRVRRAFYARARRTLALAADVIDAGATAGRARRRLLRQLGRLHEAALIADGLLAATTTNPRTAPLHHLIFDTELVIETLGRTALELDATGPSDWARRTFADALRQSRTHGFTEAAPAAERLDAVLSSPVGDAAAPHERLALLRTRALLTDLGDLAQQWTDVMASVSSDPHTGAPFSSPVVLAGGRVSGPSRVIEDALAESATAHGRRRISVPLRTAIQAAVAVAVVEPIALLLDGPRFYWAVIGVMIVLAGTNTTRDRVRKTTNRMLGTVVGGVIGIALVDLLGTTHVFASLALIIACLTIGLWGFGAFYSVWVACLVIVLCQVYAFAGGVSDGLIIDRLVLNLLGAVAAVLAAAFIFPVTTRSMIRNAVRRQLESIRTLVEHAAPGEDAAQRLRADARAVDQATVDLESVMRPLVRSVTGSAPGRDDELRTALVAAADHARAIAALPRPAAVPEDLALGIRDIIDTLATSIGGLIAALLPHAPTTGIWRRVGGDVEDLSTRLRSAQDGGAWRARLHRIGQLDDTLALLASSTGLTVAGESVALTPPTLPLLLTRPSEPR